MKYISVNSLEDFEFLESELTLNEWSNGSLSVIAQKLNIHDCTDQNPYNIDMEIRNARITFHGFEITSYEGSKEIPKERSGCCNNDSGIISLEGTEALERLLIQLRYGVRILTFDKKDGQSFIIDGFSSDPYFNVCFTFEKVTIEWDEYACHAWYTSRNN